MENQQFSFKLNPNNIQYIPIERYPNDFTFIVDGKRYETSRLVADLLSPTIRQMHFTDESSCEFTMNTNDHYENIDMIDTFSILLNLTNFEKKTIPKSKKNEFLKYFLKLGNIETYFEIIKNEIDESEPQQFLEIMNNISKEFLEEGISHDIFERYILYNDKIQAKFQEISKEFYKMSHEEIKKINIHFLEIILSNNSLQIETEDSLLNEIIELYISDHQYSKLFEYIYFDKVSDETLDKFIENFDYCDLTHEIWSRICSSLHKTKTKTKTKNTEIMNEQRYKDKTEEEKEKEKNIQTFEHQEGKEFYGIMRHLTTESGGNIHDNGTIEISSNSIYSESDHPKNLVDYEKTNYYQSKDNEFGTILFDFKDKQIHLTSYSIKSNGNSGDNDYDLKSWVVEVSKDGKEWEEIDRHENDPALKKCNTISTFQIQRDNQQFYRYIRLRQTGPSWNTYNRTVFWFYFIEFYGQLKYPTSK